MIKKHGGRWMMCIDFAYLNKYCPKNFHLLPSTNQEIVVVAGFKVLSFRNL